MLTSGTHTNDAYAWNGQVNVSRAYTANGLNQYSAVAGTSFAYDANGNLTSDGTNSYVYDVENRLVSATIGSTSATLRYDPLGRLYEVNGSTTGITRFLYDGDDLVGEYNSSGTLLRRYVHGTGSGDDPLVWFEGSGVSDAARRYLYADERGSIVAITDASGNVVAVNTYDEHGIPGASNAGRFQYTGQAWLPELGMDYYKARMYSPTLGRFMQTDPIGYGDGMNMYRYVGNDPMNAVDPSGLVEILVSHPPIDEPMRELVARMFMEFQLRGFDRAPDTRVDPCDSSSGQIVVCAQRGGASAPVSSAPQKPTSTICQRRDWHNLKVKEQVAALRAAGYEVATNVAIRLIGPDGTGWAAPGYAVADYLVKLPGTPASFRIGELKTGDAQLSMRQIQHYGTGFVEVRSANASAFGILPGQIIPVVYTGEDRAPGCPVPR